MLAACAKILSVNTRRLPEGAILHNHACNVGLHNAPKIKACQRYAFSSKKYPDAEHGHELYAIITKQTENFKD